MNKMRLRIHSDFCLRFLRGAEVRDDLPVARLLLAGVGAVAVRLVDPLDLRRGVRVVLRAHGLASRESKHVITIVYIYICLLNIL